MLDNQIILIVVSSFFGVFFGFISSYSLEYIADRKEKVRGFKNALYRIELDLNELLDLINTNIYITEDFLRVIQDRTMKVNNLHSYPILDLLSLTLPVIDVVNDILFLNVKLRRVGSDAETLNEFRKDLFPRLVDNSNVERNRMELDYMMNGYMIHLVFLNDLIINILDFLTQIKILREEVENSKILIFKSLRSFRLISKKSQQFKTRKEQILNELAETTEKNNKKNEEILSKANLT